MLKTDCDKYSVICRFNIGEKLFPDISIRRQDIN